MNKQIVYIDMDGVLVDFGSGLARVSLEKKKLYEGREDEIPSIFSLMDPVKDAIKAFNAIAASYDTYILSTAPWENPSAWSDKLLWVKKHLGENAYKRLIITHHKNLNRGDYIIDDRFARGVDEFTGEHIHFGSEKFPDWCAVTAYLGIVINED